MLVYDKEEIRKRVARSLNPADPTWLMKRLGTRRVLTITAILLLVNLIVVVPFALGLVLYLGVLILRIEIEQSTATLAIRIILGTISLSAGARVFWTGIGGVSDEELSFFIKVGLFIRLFGRFGFYLERALAIAFGVGLFRAALALFGV